MNDSQSYHMKRSFKYMCFQNQAHHFNNLINSKHCVENNLDSKSPVYQKLQSQKDVGSSYKMNQKHRKEVDRNINNENQKLLKKLHEIMQPKNIFHKRHSKQESLINSRLQSSYIQQRSRSNKNINQHQLPIQSNSFVIENHSTSPKNMKRSLSPSHQIQQRSLSLQQQNCLENHVLNNSSKFHQNLKNNTYQNSQNDFYQENNENINIQILNKTNNQSFIKTSDDTNCTSIAYQNNVSNISQDISCQQNCILYPSQQINHENQTILNNSQTVAQNMNNSSNTYQNSIINNNQDKKINVRNCLNQYNGQYSSQKDIINQSKDNLNQYYDSSGQNKMRKMKIRRRKNTSPQNPMNLSQNSFCSSYKRQNELTSIEKENFNLAKRITDCKPSIGSIEQWNKHFLQFKKNSSIRRVSTTLSYNSTRDSQSNLNNKSNLSPNKEHIKPYLYMPQKGSFQNVYQGFIKQNNICQNGNQINEQKLFTPHYTNILKLRQKNNTYNTNSRINISPTITRDKNKTSSQSPVNRSANGIDKSSTIYDGNSSVIYDRYQKVQSEYNSQKGSRLRLLSAQKYSNANYQKNSDLTKFYERRFYNNTLEQQKESKTEMINKDIVQIQQNQFQNNQRFTQNQSQTLNDYIIKQEDNTLLFQNGQQANLNNSSQNQAFIWHENDIIASSIGFQRKASKKKRSKRNKTKSHHEYNIINARSIDSSKPIISRYEFQKYSKQHSLSNQFGINSIHFDQYLQDQKTIYNSIENEEKKQKKFVEFEDRMNLSQANLNYNEEEDQNLNISDNYDEKIKQIQERYIKLDPQYKIKQDQEQQITKQQIANNQKILLNKCYSSSINQYS